MSPRWLKSPQQLLSCSRTTKSWGSGSCQCCDLSSRSPPLLQPHCLNTPCMFPPQGFCTFCFLCLECTLPRCPCVLHLSPHVSPSQEALLVHPIPSLIPLPLLPSGVTFVTVCVPSWDTRGGTLTLLSTVLPGA